MKTIHQTHNDYVQGKASPIQDVEVALQNTQSKKAESVFIKTTNELAIDQAHASQNRYKKDISIGAMDGMRVVWKDLFDQTGMVTTAASSTRQSSPVADVCATVVRQLSRAGMCSIGRTNLSEFAFSGLGLNPHFGTPRSVLSEGADLLPGGSSSGSSVAVGLGIAHVGMGTDTSGSIRIPAALNGLYGYRPSINRYSRKGVFPLSRTLDSVGCTTRSMQDISNVDRILAAPSVSRIITYKPKILDLSMSLNIPWDDEVFNGYVDALRVFETNGYVIESTNLETTSRVVDLFDYYGTLVSIEAKRLHFNLLHSPQSKMLDPMICRRLRAAPTLSESKYQEYLAERQSVIETTNSAIGNALIAFPTVTKIRHKASNYLNHSELAQELNVNLLAATMIGSFLDTPGVSLPILDGTGRVISSILISAAQGEDESLLAHCGNLARVLNANTNTEAVA